MQDEARRKNLTPSHQRTNSVGVEQTTSAAFKTLGYTRHKSNLSYTGGRRQNGLMHEYSRAFRKGHDAKLDLASDNKVVNNDPSKFFLKVKRDIKTAVPMGISKADNKLVLRQ